jgi:hypothetical protein
MNTRRPWLYISLVVLFTAAFTVSLHLTLSSADPQLSVRAVYYAPVVGIAVAYLMTFQIGSMSCSPIIAMNAMSYQLRSAGLIVRTDGLKIHVRLGMRLEVKIRLRPKGQACRVSYELGMSQKGAFWLILLGLIFPPAGLLVAMIVLGKSIRFGEGELRGVLSRASQSHKDGERGIKELLVESLSEARRISLEAHETLKSDYEDLLILSLVAGILALFGTMTFVVLLDAWGYVEAEAIFISTAMVAAFFIVTAVSVFLVWRRFKPRLDDLENWKDLLHSACTVEAAPAEEDLTPDSSFELLARVTKELPSWLEIRRKSMLAREPLLSMIVFLVTLYGFFACLGGAFRVESDVLEGAIAMALGAALFIGGIILYMVSDRRRAVEARSLAENWESRSREIDLRIDRLLGGCQ